MNTGSVYNDSDSTVIRNINYFLDRPLTEPGVYTVTATVEFFKSPANYSVSVATGTLYVNPSPMGAKAVRPSLICVEEMVDDPSGFTYVANFAYRNENATAVYVPYGENNMVVGDAGSFSADAPVLFQPGAGTFRVFFNGNRIYWSLTTSESGRRTAIASEASSNSNRCQKLDAYASPLTIYPNPVRNTIHLKLSDYNGSDIRVEAYNELELRAYTLEARFIESDGSFELDFTNANPGFYRLIVTYGNSTIVQRLIKE
jgi:hypothetical protein